MGYSPRISFLVLLYLISVFSTTYGDLFNYGTDAGDQAIEFSRESNALALIQGYPYYGEGQNDVYINPNGAISFGSAIDDTDTKLDQQAKSAIAVLYAPASDGTIFYRTEREEGESTREAMRKIRRAFARDAQDFRASYSIIVTWEGLKSGESDVTNTFQAALVTDGRTSYAFLLYKEIGWTNIDGKFAQSGFYFQDGRNQKMVNAETENLRELTSISNFDEDGVFLFRVSGQQPEDPRESTQTDPEEEDYEYGDQPEYNENAVENQPAAQGGCPPDPYKDNCPDGCRVLTDDKGCSLCVCPNPPPQPRTDLLPQETNELEPQQPQQRPQTGNQVAELRPDQSEIQDQPYQQQPEVQPQSPQQDPNQQAINTLLQEPTTEGMRCSEVQQRGERPCHDSAECVDHNTGFCCQCREGFYGNGKECLPNNTPQRINGNFEGAINGKTIPRTDLYTFVQIDDGQQHTALARIPRENGWNLLLLDPIGNIMGWLFAKRGSNGAYNGFDLTGGVFNRTVTIHLGDRYAILVKQEFSGRHIQDYLNVNVFVSGTLPELAEGAEVIYSKYEESYRREGPGFVRSYTDREIKVRDANGEKKYRMTIDQQIHYKECPHKEFDKEPVMVLKVDRISAHYTPSEEVVRYASMNAITGHETSDNPHQRRDPDRMPAQEPVANTQQQGVCAEGNHMCTLPNMFCNPVEQSYRCECLPGYMVEVDNSVQLRFICVDIDECFRGSHTCDRNADCANTDGSFVCQCRSGFSGDGFRCQQEGGEAPQQPLPAGTYPCTDHHECHQWGECYFQQGASQGYCKCRGWYVGDGKNNCGPPEEQIQPPQVPMGSCGGYQCDYNADCLPSPTNDNPDLKECVCRPGYHGNGLQCQVLQRPDHSAGGEPSISLGTVCRSHEECGENSNCVYSHEVGHYRCECIPPYKGDGITCTAEVTVRPVIVEPAGGGLRLSGCDKVDFCDPNADCVFERNAFGAISYICRCQPGYTGNGLKCLKSTLDVQDHQTCEQKLNCDPNARCVYDVDRQQSICQCSDGYEGDGRFCTIIIQDDRNRYDTVKECRDQTDCHQNGHCVLKDTENKYYCECLPGHRGDGVNRCEPADQCSPAEPSSCGANSECTYSAYESAYVCKCQHGYVGDGRTCYPQPPPQPPQAPQAPQAPIGQGVQPQQPVQPGQPAACDQNPQICNVDANCVYNRQESRYTCVCRAGYSGDGYSSCVREVSCFIDRSICDTNAQCVPDGKGFYVCNCNYGYHGNGRHCHLVSEQRSDTLLVGKGMSIIHRSVSPEIIGRQLVVVPHQVVVDIDFDCTNERLYWSDISGHVIRTAALNGTDVKAFFENELKSPEGVAIDWSSRNLYYADSIKDEIGVVSLDGKYQKALLTEGLVNPRAVEIDLNHRHIYYSDWHRENPRIGRMDMDGSNNQVFVKDDINLPNGLAIIQSRQELCWVDAGSQRLSCIGLDGRNRRVVYAPLEYPFGLTVRNDERFYWTDWKDHKIHSVTIYGADYTSFVPSTGGGGKLYGIISIPSKCQGNPSQCAQNNGGCQYLCLPGQQRAKCACPDNVKDLEGC